MTNPATINPFAVHSPGSAGIGSQPIYALPRTLAEKFTSSDLKVLDDFVLSYSRSAPLTHCFLPRILEIVDRHHSVFHSSGIASAFRSTINFFDGAQGLLHELELFDVVESCRHRIQPTKIHSFIGEQQIDVRTSFFDGVDVLFEAKMGRTRGKRMNQFKNMVHAAMHVGAKLVYVSSQDVPSKGFISLSELKAMLDHSSPQDIVARFHLAHEANLYEYGARSTEAINARMESYRDARSTLQDRRNRDNAPLLDNQLRSLSSDKVILIWNWIASDPEQSDQRFQQLYDDGLAKLIVADSSRQLLRDLVNS